MLVLAISLLWQAYGIAGLESLSSPGAFPIAASGVMLIAAATIVFGDQRKGQSVGRWPDILPFPVIGVFLALFVFAAVLDHLGFLLTAFGFLIATIGFLGRGGLLRTFGISCSILIAIYVIFRLVFRVILPEGIIDERGILARLSDHMTWLGQQFYWLGL